jgi:hypothetical protein
VNTVHQQEGMVLRQVTGGIEKGWKGGGGG